MAEATRFKDLISPQKLNCVGSTHLITLLAAYIDNFQDLEGLPKSQGKNLTLVMVFVFQRCNLKLFSQYYGHYKILKRTAEVMSESELSAVSEFHPIFYASIPTKFIGVELVPLQVVQPATVGRLFRLIPCQGSKLHFLVRWTVDGADLCPWGAAVYLVKIHPKFHPWGQGCGNEGGIVVGLAVGREFDRNCDSKSPAEKLDEGFVELGNQDRILEIEDSSAIQNSIVN